MLHHRRQPGNANYTAAANVTQSFTVWAPQVQPAYQCSGSGSSLTCSPVAIPLTTGTQVHLILFGTGVRGAETNGISVTIGGVAATVEYAGPQGQYPAFDQVNMLVPPSLAGAGEVQLILTGNGIAANPVTVQFQ